MFAATWLGTGAATTAAHPYGLQVDGLDVLREAGTAGGTLFGTDPASIVVAEHFGDTSTLDFVVDDPAREVELGRGQNVYMVDFFGFRLPSGAWVADDLFRGTVAAATAEYDGTTGRRWRVHAVGLDALQDRRVLTAGVIPAGAGVTPALQQILGALDNRISAQQFEIDALTVQPGSGGRLLDVLLNTTLAAVPLAGKTARQACRDIIAAGHLTAQVVRDDVYAGDDIVDVDPQGRARYAPSTGALPLGAYRDGAAPSTPTPYNVRPATLDAGSVFGSVYVRGADAAASGWVFGRDAGIEAQGYLEAPEAVTAAQRDAAAAVFLAAHAAGATTTFELLDAHDAFFPVVAEDYRRGWHARAVNAYIDSPLIPLGGLTLGRTLTVRRTFPGGGALHIETVFTNYAANAGGFALRSGIGGLQATITAVDDRARAAGRLAGSLDEVAVRAKDGPPTDADFYTPRDGFLVIDTATPALWVRAGGTWLALPSSGWTSYTPTVGGGGTVTWTTQEGRYYRIGRTVFVHMTLTVNAAGSGVANVTIDTPTAPDRGAGSRRQVMAAHLEGVTVAGMLGTGALVALAGGAGATWDRLRAPDDSATNRDGNVTGAELLAGAIIAVQGWYEEA